MSISGLGGGSFGGIRGNFQPPSFQSLDTNSDESLTLDELKAGAPGGASAANDKRTEALFKAMDADGNGSVSSDEKSAFDDKMADQQSGMAFMAQQMQFPSNADIFANTDSNSDGSVSLDEFSASDAAKNLSSDQLQSLFSTIDSDSDGSISETESSDFLDSLKSGLAENGPPPPPPGGGGPGGPGDAGGPPPGPPPDQASSSSSEDDSSSSALDLLSMALSAYGSDKSSSSSSDLLSSLTSLLQKAA